MHLLTDTTLDSINCKGNRRQDLFFSSSPGVVFLFWPDTNAFVCIFQLNNYERACIIFQRRTVWLYKKTKDIRYEIWDYHHLQHYELRVRDY